MESFEFTIPVSLDELLESSSTKQYVVNTVYASGELYKNVQVPYYFDTFYSVVVNFSSVDEELQIKAWEHLIRVLTKVNSDVAIVLEDNEFSSHDAKKWLNTIKMSVYIACNLLESFEKQENKPTIDTVALTKSRKKAPKKSDVGFDWDKERDKMLLQLYSMLQFPLNRFWDPPVAEEDFVNLIANCCYKILETPSMNLVRTKATRDSIFQIIGVLIKKFNHGLACALKLMQLLQHFDHLVSCISQGVVLLIESFGICSIVPEIIREVSKVDSRDLAKDSSSLRNYALFLSEVGDKHPNVMVPSLSLLIRFLDQDAYTLRNCVLSILASLVLHVLNGESLDEKQRDLRDQCLDYLEDHIHDIHAFVRSKVLQLWIDLVNEKVVPLVRQQSVLKLIIGRLKDKSSNVRKNAVLLLTAFLKCNPFAAKLSLEDLHKQYEQELKVLQEIDTCTKEEMAELQWDSVKHRILEVVQDYEPEESDGRNIQNFELNAVLDTIAKNLLSGSYEKAVSLLSESISLCNGSEIFRFDKEEGLSEEYEELNAFQLRLVVVLKRIFISHHNMEADKNKNEDDIEKITKQRLLVSYLENSVGFAELIQSSLPVITQLLSSRHLSDVTEAVQFFLTAFEFGVLYALTGIRKMLSQIWNKEAAVRDCVVRAYKKLYIDVEAPNERMQAMIVVQNLTTLIAGSTFGELTSLEEIISQFVASGDLNHNCFTLLWERFTKALPDTSDEDSKAALTIISMAASSKPEIISSNLQIIMSVALGDRGKADFGLVKEACNAICKISAKKVSSESPDPSFRLEQDHELFVLLKHFIVEGIESLNDRQYIPMVISAITCIYKLAEHPDIICGEIIHLLSKKLMKIHDNCEDKQNDGGLSVSSAVLAHFLTVAGHIALCQLNHLDVSIFTELKRRNFLNEEHKEKKKKKKKLNDKRMSVTSAYEASRHRIDTEPDDEMGLTGATADDLEAEYIRSICESSLLAGESLLAIIRPLIINVCSNPTKYEDSDLRCCATMALAKFMMISSEVCEEYLQLLFTILEKSAEETIRSNTLIALADLSLHFPNQVEPWTPRLYARLRDESILVRRNTLIVLSHLILHDMVKVKGLISDIALCIKDEDSRLSGLSKHFFSELAHKGNSLYNVLPDIISRLSDNAANIKESEFQKIIQHIFSLIQKDKQWETLVEKLCYRLEACIDIRQSRDITFCLSLVQYNDRCIRKLAENFQCYAEVVHDNSIYDLFLSITSSAMKSVKPEQRVIVEELENRIQMAHEKGAENVEVITKASQADKRKTTPEMKAKIRCRSAKKRQKEDDEDDDDHNEYTLHPVHRNRQSTSSQLSAKRSTKKRTTILEGSDDDFLPTRNDSFCVGSSTVRRSTRKKTK